VNHLSSVTAALGSAYGFEHENLLDLDRAVAIARCVRPTDAVAYLWSIGLSPWAIGWIHATSRRSTTGAPSDVYEQVLLRTPRGTELIAAMERRMQSAATFPWDQWLSQVGPDPAGPGEWASTGLPWGLVVALSQGGYGATDVRALAATGRGTLAAAARTLVKWINAGCRPPVDVLVRLKSMGLDHMIDHVSAAVVQRLDDLLADDGLSLPATHRGLLFAAAGSAVSARSWVRAGITDPFEVAERSGRGQLPELSEVRSTQLQ
jgi:hypothetical protein